MWDLPRQGLEPVSSALAGRFLTTAPPGKSQHAVFLFLFLAALGLSCSMQDLCCGMQDLSLRCVGSSLWHTGFSSCGAQAPERACSRARGLCSLWHTGSLVEAHRLSCPMACGILVPQPGIEPASPALEGVFLTTGPPGKSPSRSFYVAFYLHP